MPCVSHIFYVIRAIHIKLLVIISSILFLSLSSYASIIQTVLSSRRMLANFNLNGKKYEADEEEKNKKEKQQYHLIIYLVYL